MWAQDGPYRYEIRHDGGSRYEWQVSGGGKFESRPALSIDDAIRHSILHTGRKPKEWTEVPVEAGA